MYPTHYPILLYPTSMYNELGNHIQNAQNSGLPGDYVSGGGGTPLHRVVDESIQTANRAIACGSWTNPQPGVTSCDEYPFASTIEGAASGPSGGRTFPGCEIPQLPSDGSVTGPIGFSACYVNDSQNSYAGVELGVMYQHNRVMAGDSFFVDVV